MYLGDMFSLGAGIEKLTSGQLIFARKEDDTDVGIGGGGKSGFVIS